MRSKRAALNSIFAILAEIVSVICGFILPRLILSAFGSKYNGITTSVSQFLSYMALLRAGVGGVTRAALYNPLANGDSIKLSGIVNATQAFMKRLSIIYLVLAIGLASIYPVLVRDEFGWLFSFSLVIIMCMSTFAQNFFGMAYIFVIEADQRSYIHSIINILTTIANTAIASLLIIMGSSIHIVKLGSSIVFALNPIFLSLYVKKKYKIDKSVAKDDIAIKQRWDAFAQQVGAFVNYNTDMIILTIFSNLAEVSVYSVYQMVIKGLNGFQNAIVNSFEAAFGDLIARKEYSKLQKVFKTCEFISFGVGTFFWTCAGLLMVSFVSIYTTGVTDVSYIRPVFATLACVSAFFDCTRRPYVMLVSAAGHFRQIRTGSIITPIINIVISVILVPRYGVDGVMVGTICAMVFMVFQYGIYSSRSILSRNLGKIAANYLISILEVFIAIVLWAIIPLPVANNYFQFFVHAILVACTVLGDICLISFIFRREELSNTFTLIIKLLRRRGKRFI